MAISKQEQQLFNVIKENYKGRILQSFRPEFLKNEKTGSNLEIDIYLPNHRIGFEFQGAIHFEKIKRYNNNPDKSRENDSIKSGISEKTFLSRYVIVEVFEQDLSGDILANIIQRCKNMQEYYFDNRYYRKCMELEKFLQYLQNDFNQRTVRWFDLIDKIMNYRQHGDVNNKHRVNNLINFYFDDNVVLPQTDMYDLKKLSMVLYFDKIYLSKAAKIELRKTA